MTVTLVVDGDFPGLAAEWTHIQSNTKVAHIGTSPPILEEKRTSIDLDLQVFNQSLMVKMGMQTMEFNSTITIKEKKDVPGPKTTIEMILEPFVIDYNYDPNLLVEGEEVDTNALAQNKTLSYEVDVQNTPGKLASVFFHSGPLSG